jgi:hypothetical protein
VEAALSIHLESYATSLGSREQLAIGEFATALLVLPKTLAVNAAKDATELVGPGLEARQGAHGKVLSEGRMGKKEWERKKPTLNGRSGIGLLGCWGTGARLASTQPRSGHRPARRSHSRVSLPLSSPQVAALRSYHHRAQTNPADAALSRMGLDLVEGKLRDNVSAGVLEPAMSKVKMIQVRRALVGGGPTRAGVLGRVCGGRDVADRGMQRRRAACGLLSDRTSGPILACVCTFCLSRGSWLTEWPRPLSQFATEAAITILRIDDLIRLEAPQGEE